MTGAYPPADRLESILISRIARYHRVPPGWVVVANGIQSLLFTLFHEVSSIGQLIVFPPTDDGPARSASDAGCDLIAVPRSATLQVQAGAFPDGVREGCTAYCMSPNDPDGSRLPLQDAVTLARAVSCLIIDERHSAYSIRDHLPLQHEFDHVVLVRTLETWGGLTEHPIAYAIASSPMARAIRKNAPQNCTDPRSLFAGITSFEHARYLDAAARAIMRERTHLIRALRKLNMVHPMPSAANFVLARLERGNRADLKAFLDKRGILVHYPDQPGLNDTIRITAMSASATRALTDALIDWARAV